MKHNRILKDLVFFLDNELSPERKSRIEKHLGECAECRGFLAFLEQGIQVIEKEKNPPVSPFFYTRISARLDERPEAPAPARWIRVAQPAFFTLLLAFGIAGGMIVGSNASFTKASQPSTTLQWLNDFEAEPIESFLLDNR